MPKIVIYTTPFCGYCSRAKSLLKKKRADYEEIDVFMDGAARKEMAAKSGERRTVPQIFIDDRHIGGCEELYALERAGELESLLRDR